MHIMNTKQGIFKLTAKGYFLDQQLLNVMQQGEEKVLLHVHKDFYELVNVFNGSAQNVRSVGSETIHAGHVFIMPEGSVHQYRNLKDFRYYNILFQPSLLKMGGDLMSLETLTGSHPLFDFQGAGENRMSRILTVNESVLAKLVIMLSELHNELENRHRWWQESAYFMFMQILITLLRTGSPAESADKVENVFSIGKAIRLMEDDYTQKFTIRSLAHIAGMSSSCFRHKFVRTMGLPPMEYLMMLRLRKALLLLNGPASVGEVARQSGFPDSNYFSRLIRHYFGYSPREIRKKYNSGKLTPNMLLKDLPLNQPAADQETKS